MPNRIRLQMPGWRTGRLNMRCGNPNDDTYGYWRDMLRAAHRETYWDVLDAIADRELGLPEAHKIYKRSGLDGLRKRVRQIREEAAAKAASGKFKDWFAEFIELTPRKNATKAQHEYIKRRCEFFLEFLADRHALDSLWEVTPDLWTTDGLRAYVASYIATKTAEAEARLERRWAEVPNPPNKVERQELLERERAKKAVTANRHVNAVGAMSQWLLEKDRVPEDPAPANRITTTVEKQHRRNDHKHLEREDWHAFLRASRRLDESAPVESVDSLRPDTLFWEWLVASGATTYTEGKRLRVADIDFRNEARAYGVALVPVQISGSKAAARDRTVPIPLALARRIRARARQLGIADDRLVFPFDEDQGRYWWDKVVELMREDDREAHERVSSLSPYALRHTFAVNTLAAGADIRQLQTLMGHANLATTEIYLSNRPTPHEALAQSASSLGLANIDTPRTTDLRERAQQLIEQARNNGDSTVDLLVDLMEADR